MGVREKDAMDGEPTGIDVGQRKHGRGRATCRRGQHEAENSGGSSGREEESRGGEKNVVRKKIFTWRVDGLVGSGEGDKKFRKIHFLKQDE